MQQTKIDYLDMSWNPLAMRCTPVSEACEHCWHLRMANRMAGNLAFPDDVRAAYAGDAEPMLIRERLEAPLHRRKPARIGVQFMGDLFHKDVTFDSILLVWREMFYAYQHTFLVLTKRPERMGVFLNEWLPSAWRLAFLAPYPGVIPHIWLGVTAENQQRADERIPLLLQCPAAVRFVSIEPVLGPVNLQPYLYPCCNYCNGTLSIEPGDRRCLRPHWGNLNSRPGLDQVIVGGETGPGARPMNPDWARDVRDQCKAAGVPFFFKRWGDNPNPWCNEAAAAGWDYTQSSGGHLIDGQEWHQFPEACR